jgi:hypothetical protein
MRPPAQCESCGEADPDPSVEAFEVFGLIVCADCACELFEADDDYDWASPVDMGSQ